MSSTWQQTHPRFKPALGSGIKKDMTIDEFFAFVRYPVIATPKFDGIRGITIPSIREPERGHECSIVCRSMSYVPNSYIFDEISTHCPPGLDGEIETYDSQLDLLVTVTSSPRPFYRVQSDVMSFLGQPNFKFHVFDFHDFSKQNPHLIPYEERLKRLGEITLPSFCVRVPERFCATREELEKFESEMVEAGYEGICWRHPLSIYKYGRSTLREQALIKMKRFQDAEAIIEGCYEEMHNQNQATTNALGHTERSSHQANMVGKHRLGGFTVRSTSFLNCFNVGSGFDSAQRENYWKIRETLIGKTITFKFQPHGGKDRPRIPIFKSIRDLRDLG